MTAPATVLPSSLGFHCDGQCWEQAGQAPALVRWLEREKSASARDWFVLGTWAQEQEPQVLPLPPMGEIHTLQDYVAVEAVARYREAGLTSSAADQEFYETHPTLFLWEGRYYIFQGTHRFAALYANNAATYCGWLLDLDAL